MLQQDVAELSVIDDTVQTFINDVLINDGDKDNENVIFGENLICGDNLISGDNMNEAELEIEELD